MLKTSEVSCFSRTGLPPFMMKRFALSLSQIGCRRFYVRYLCTQAWSSTCCCQDTLHRAAEHPSSHRVFHKVTGSPDRDDLHSLRTRFIDRVRWQPSDDTQYWERACSQHPQGDEAPPSRKSRIRLSRAFIKCGEHWIHRGEAVFLGDRIRRAATARMASRAGRSRVPYFGAHAHPQSHLSHLGHWPRDLAQRFVLAATS